MFASAVNNVKQCTFPIIISSRRVDGVCSSGLGTFVIINEEGWIVTAWHIVQAIVENHNSVNAYEALVAERKAIEDDTTINNNTRHRLLNNKKIPGELITNFSIFYGFNGLSITNFEGIPEADLAVGKLEGFNPDLVKVYPAFKDPAANMDPGSSLCKLGFPFHIITPTFDAATGFNLPDGSLPVPYFPLEGIFTRNVIIQEDGARPYPLKFVETSSPGLRGQSGGPTFDVHGNIWAIQSQTRHLKLGFGTESNNLKAKQKEILENQYLHVGWGVHSETIIGLLNEKNIKYNISL